MQKLNEGEIGDAYEIFGHEIRKGAGTDKSFSHPVLQLCIDFALLMNDYGWAEGIYEFNLKDKERAEQMKRLAEQTERGNWNIKNDYAEKHSQKIIEGMQKAYQNFEEAIKDLPENNTDLKEIYGEVMQVIDEKITEFESKIQE